ncbi:MAG TPA: hypothetical protein VL240_03160 [Candidatus Binatia bacterium]|nr:hypothetical protein [Candidatus Binatia bacterium]
MIPQLQRETPVSLPGASPQWSLATRIGFRFAFSYFFLYISQGAVGSLGLNEKLTGYRAVFASLWSRLVPWVGTNILGLKDKLREVPNGSGDQLYDYVLVGCMFVVACVATAIWSVLDRKRTNYRQLHQWLRLAMRLLLVTALMNYGAAKIFPMQFADIPLARFVDPLGHTSPQGLLWVFMGFSEGYGFFCGFAELLGGLLVMVPRLTTLGALISLGALANVLMLNLCYDVPRKIFTTHLVLVCMFLVLPDARRLVNFFLANRAVEPATMVPFLKDRLLNHGVLALQYLYCLAILALCLVTSYRGAVQNKTYVDASLRGIWLVEEFVVDNVPQPALVTNVHRWHHVVFDFSDLFTIQPMDGPLQLCRFTLDGAGKNLELVELDDPSWKARFTLESRDGDHMLMTGEANGTAISATLRKVDLSDPTKFLLRNRGFHWVTPAPRWR